MDFRGIQVHEPCGAEVLAFGALGGGDARIERVMRPGQFGLEMVIHDCRDYADWHRSVPDRRDPFTVDVSAGWQPGRRSAVPEAVGA